MLLLTGAPGWLGTRLVEVLRTPSPTVPEAKLLAHQPLRCLVLPKSDTAVLKQLDAALELTPGDVTQADTLPPFFANAEGSTLVHLAGLIHPQRYVRDFYAVNVQGTENLLKLALKHGVRKVVLMSSNSQSGCNPHTQHRFTEDSPYNPYMNYGRSKMEMELLAKRYSEDKGMNITILRTCWFYGPHQPERQSRFFQMIRKGQFPLLGSGSNKRSMSYVDNTCQGICLAATKPEAKGKTYWIADERPYSMLEIVQTVAEVMRDDFGFTVSQKQRHLPSFIGDVAYAADYLLQGVGLYQKELHVLSEMNRSIACSIERAKNELGYNPRTGLRDGMKASIRWALDHGHEL